ncbi:MAG: hypothetical protein LBR34_07220 [Prevotella sp.]|jgi:hypothetical protein|nr:hypothetical protein [Prevotella sp.]
MPDKQCPLCGKSIGGAEALCGDCLETSRKRELLNVVPDDIDRQQASPEPLLPENPPAAPPQSHQNNLSTGGMTTKDKKYFSIFVLSLVLCAAMAYGFFTVRKNTKEELKTELGFWYACIEKNTPTMYSSYLMNYPRGKFSRDAREKIGELRETERSDWEKIKKSATIDDFDAFLRTYPDTPFKNEAKKIMDSLYWIAAAKENTAASYNDYLEKVQLHQLAGFYEGVAREHYDYLSSIKELTEAETAVVKKTMDKFFYTLSRQEYNHLGAFFGKIITNFYGAKNRTATAIISSIKADMEKNKIKSLIYSPDFDSLKSYKDGNGLIVTEITVKKKIAYRHKKAVEIINDTLCIDINPDMSIKSLYEKEM